jgi:VanZ family protein
MVEVIDHRLSYCLPDRTPSRHTVLLAWIPAIIWVMVIATESTKTFSANHTFTWLSRLVWLFQIKLTGMQILYLNGMLRKLGHFTGYAILSWVAFRGWTETLAWQKFRRTGRVIRRWHLRAAVLAVLCTIAVAALDEFHQSFLAGRTGVFHDVILDSMGGIFVQFVLLLFWSWKKNKLGQTLTPAPAVTSVRPDA